MAETKVPLRSEIDPQFTWNAPSVYADQADWEKDLEQVAGNVSRFAEFQGHLGDAPSVLADALDAFEALMRGIGKVYIYAMMSHNVDMKDQDAAAMFGKAQGGFGLVMATIAFMDPELIAIGETTLRRWMQEEPRLANFGHYIDDLFRKQAHVRSAEVEEILGMLVDPFGGVSSTAGMLTNADFQFEAAVASDGSELPVTQGSLSKILAEPDREARRTAWEHYADLYLGHKNTLASTLATSIKQNVFQSRVRHHPSTLEAALFDNNVPGDVFHNLIATFKKHLPTWHRYWALRRKALGVDTLNPYDIWAPLVKDQIEVPYAQAVEWICEGLAPLGEEYVGVLRKGALEDRWVDVYPNQGKRAGAFSAGWPGTHPFILLTYNDNILSLSTLAHELGHSMHSYLTWQNQPLIYSQYSLFVAEVASNFHQVMVREHLLANQKDPAFQIALIEEAMSNFHRYFFIMPTLARFEQETHSRIEQGKSLTADIMIDLMADLFTEGYGGEMHVDRERVGITWATFSHLYIDYYVYQYATGISGAHALSKGVLAGQTGAVDNYLQFLKSGNFLYPLDALKVAGADLMTPQAVEITFGVLAGMVDRLEELLA